MKNLKAFLEANGLRPELIVYLLQQGIEMERLKCQAEELIKIDNHDSTIRVLQGERLVSILRLSRLT